MQKRTKKLLSFRWGRGFGAGKKELLFLLLLASCGDLPRPFQGNPGANALRLSVPPPARLVVPAPDDGLLAAPEAMLWAQAVTTALVAEEIPAFAKQARPGEWTLHLSARLQANRVVPRYTLLDAKGASRGDVQGAPVDAALWAQGRPALLQDCAQKAAPEILALLRSVDATIKQSDPNSLYNRPAKVFFTGVTGAPGDGNVALGRAMRAKLPDTGDELVDRPQNADFQLFGTVHVSPTADGQQLFEIHWSVVDNRRVVFGNIEQDHVLPTGTLAHHWGDVAEVIAEQAAGGVHEAIVNYVGHKKPAKPPAS